MELFSQEPRQMSDFDLLNVILSTGRPVEMEEVEIKSPSYSFTAKKFKMDRK